MKQDASGPRVPEDRGKYFPGSLDPTNEAAADAAAVATLKPVRLNRGALSWSLYEGGRDPYVILITIYIFAPYFAKFMVGDPVKGQALVANITTIQSLFVALTAPFLGASIEMFGRRKPLLFMLTAAMVPLMASLWWAKPDGSGLSVMTVSVILGLIGCLFAYGEVLHNSLLVRAATPREAPYASGLALSLGNFFSVFVLSFVLWAFVLPGAVEWGWVPKTPLFGLDKAAHEPDRIVGPIAAALLGLGAIPLFLFTPDAPAGGLKLAEALKRGAGNLVATLKNLRNDRDVGVYLGSRMLFTDGMTSLLAFGGVYAIGVMRWGVLEMLAYGIMLSIFAVLGGYVGAKLDSVIGPKHAVRLEVGAAIVCLIGQLSMGREKILFMPFDPKAHAPVWHGPMFTSLSEILYLLIGLGTAIFVTAHYASSRTMLTRLVPADKITGYFGLYALSGTVTVWVGSALVGWATSTFKTQQAGFLPIALLLAAGFVGMLFVKGGNREHA